MAAVEGDGKGGCVCFWRPPVPNGGSQAFCVLNHCHLLEQTSCEQACANCLPLSARPKGLRLKGGRGRKNEPLVRRQAIVAAFQFVYACDILGNVWKKGTGRAERLPSQVPSPAP
ncbi:hypothetical protein MATL_G00245300 [Megalops atlanticus]|uniref:Uncharacterized protein n=1 Tax=Megalops atlanticus TaxID=7932 RepID=A0A9D3PC38_MEGAT|nr:hypothetical protein MATL_G00245300 [Megalops atlanticus]